MCKIDFYNKLNDNHSHSHLINVIKQGEFMKILRNINNYFVKITFL